MKKNHHRPASPFDLTFSFLSSTIYLLFELGGTVSTEISRRRRRRSWKSSSPQVRKGTDQEYISRTFPPAVAQQLTRQASFCFLRRWRGRRENGGVPEQGL